MEGTEDKEKEKDKISKGRSSLYAGAFLTAVGVSLAIATGGSILLAVPISLAVGAAVGYKFPQVTQKAFDGVKSVGGFFKDKIASAANITTDAVGKVAEKALTKVFGEEKSDKIKESLTNVKNKVVDIFSSVKNALTQNKEEDRTALDGLKNCGRSTIKATLIGAAASAVLALVFPPLAVIPLIAAAPVLGLASGILSETSHFAKQGLKAVYHNLKDKLGFDTKEETPEQSKSQSQDKTKQSEAAKNNESESKEKDQDKTPKNTPDKASKVLTGQSPLPESTPEKAKKILGIDNASSAKEMQGIEKQTLKNLAKSVSGISEANQGPTSDQTPSDFKTADQKTR